MARSYSRKREDGELDVKKSTQVTLITVRRRPGRLSEGLLNDGRGVFPCALGRGGTTVLKREGDGATPRMFLSPLHGYFRPDRLHTRQSGLLLVPVTDKLGWCDTPGDRNYNRPVTLPYRAGHEKMWRQDHLYDVVIVLDWNIRERRRGFGSAIFLHIAKPGLEPTEGCIAVSAAHMRLLLSRLSRRTRIRVTA